MSSFISLVYVERMGTGGAPQRSKRQPNKNERFWKANACFEVTGIFCQRLPTPPKNKKNSITVPKKGTKYSK